jgi:hypothetical protein
MNKISRINARKVVLSYFYARIISENLDTIKEIVKFDKEEKSLKFIDVS